MNKRYWKIESTDKSLMGASQVIFDHNLRKIEAGGLVDWDLFPYKMTDQNNFYDRNHPKNLNPNSLSFKNYWDPFIKSCIEGRWILDGGTWVLYDA